MDRQRATRNDFRHYTCLTTRWSDNDAYGHLNNVVYYSLFDTAVNKALIEEGLLDVERSEIIGLVVETGCRYAEPLAFPEAIDAGLRVAHLGRSSVRYEIGLFKQDAAEAAAQGHFVHVYVERATRQATEIPEVIRSFLASLKAQ